MDFLTKYFDFKGHGVEVFIDENSNPWWSAREVCDMLAIKNVSHALIELDRDEKQDVSGAKLGKNISKLRLVSESGLYSLIFKSRKPEAERFKDWVFDEVLPSIRKTGGYIHGANEMTEQEIMAMALKVAEATLAERDKRIIAERKLKSAVITIS